jgi:hypothetical protein
MLNKAKIIKHIDIGQSDTSFVYSQSESRKVSIFNVNMVA